MDTYSIRLELQELITNKRMNSEKKRNDLHSIQRMNHNNMVQMLFEYYQMKHLKSFCSVNKFEPISQAKDKKKFIANYLKIIRVLDDNGEVSNILMTSKQYTQPTEHDLNVFKINDDSDTESISNSFSDDENSSNDKNHPTNDTNIASISTPLNDDVVEIVVKSIDEDERLNDLSFFTKRLIKSMLKQYESVTYSGLYLSPSFKMLPEEDLNLLKAIFQIDNKDIISFEKMLTIDTFENEDDFMTIFTPSVYNLIAESFEKPDIIKKGGMDYDDFDDMFDILTYEEFRFINKFFGKDSSSEGENRPYKRSKDSSTVNNENYLSPSANTTPITVTPASKTVSDYSSTISSSASSSSTMASHENNRCNSSVSSRSIRNLSKSISSDSNGDLERSMVQYQVNNAKKNYQGKKTMKKVMKKIKNMNEDQNSISVQQQVHTMEARISTQITYDDDISSRYIIKLDILATRGRNKNIGKSLYGFQPFYIHSAIESAQKELKSDIELKFPNKEFQFDFFKLKQCAQPGSNQYHEEDGQHPNQKFFRYHLYMVLSIMGGEHAELKTLVPLEKKNHIERIVESYLKFIFEHRKCMEYFYVNCFEKSTYERRDSDGYNTPMDRMSEYPKTFIKDYISKMGRHVASTQTQPSDFFRKLINCTFSFHHDLVMYNFVTPNDMEEFMNALNHKPEDGNEDSEIENIFQTRKWYSG